MNFKDNGFPLKKGQVNLITGTRAGGIYLCIEPGAILVTWDDDSTDTIETQLGSAYNFVVGTKSTAIVSGKYHLA